MSDDFEIAETAELDIEKVADLKPVFDVPLHLSCELGRTEITLGELMKIGAGTVLELNKLAGEPLEVLINKRLVARGEVVVINEKYGIRLTDIIDPSDSASEEQKIAAENN